MSGFDYPDTANQIPTTLFYSSLFTNLTFFTLPLETLKPVISDFSFLIKSILLMNQALVEKESFLSAGSWQMWFAIKVSPFSTRV